MVEAETPLPLKIVPEQKERSATNLGSWGVLGDTRGRGLKSKHPHGVRAVLCPLVCPFDSLIRLWRQMVLLLFPLPLRKQHREVSQPAQGHTASK